jgi:hypothetical protein
MSQSDGTALAFEALSPGELSRAFSLFGVLKKLRVIICIYRQCLL